MTIDRAMELLQTYSFDELIEVSELTHEEVLVLLDEQGLLKLPETEPL